MTAASTNNTELSEDGEPLAVAVAGPELKRESSEPESSPTARRLPPTPLLATYVVTAFWAGLFTYLIWRRHDHFGTFAFDISVYDQAVWLLSQGKSPFITVRGLHFFGFHANIAMFAFVPAYWLGGGIHVLNIAQAVSLAAGAIPVHLIARDRLGGSWFGFSAAAIYLLNPTIQWLVWETFHPESMAILPLLYAIWFALNHRWKAMGVALMLALLWKEDIALSVTMFGIYLLVTNPKARRVGIAVMLAGLAWWQLTGKVLIAHFNQGSAFYTTWFGDLGSSASEIAKTTITQPSKVIPKFQDPTSVNYAWEMLRPFGFIALLAPWALMIAAPQVFVNTIANQTFFRNYQAHYAAVPVVAILWAFVEAVRLWGWKPSLRWGLVSAAILASLWSSYYSGMTPWSTDAFAWAPERSVFYDQQRAAVDTVPDDASVSAIYNLNPHLAQREHIYEWPNPWIPRNWGNDDVANVPDPGIIEYIVVDRTLLGDTTDFFAELMADGDFEILYDEGNQVVAQRVAGFAPLLE